MNLLNELKNILRDKRVIRTLSAVSATLNVKDVSRKRKFSVGTKPSKNILIPKKSKDITNKYIKTPIKCQI